MRKKHNGNPNYFIKHGYNNAPRGLLEKALYLWLLQEWL
jgi:hypothetical protein